MTALISKPKLSSIISSQLPEFVQEDYQTFVAFVEAYYNYLEENTILDFKTVGDIDTTLDAFISHFKNELALNFPTLSVPDKFLLPRIRQLYNAKGSEESYRLLFRLLYNKDIELYYPSQQMLRVSDGKWTHDTSIFIKVKIGTPDLVVGKYVNIEADGKIIKVFIDRYTSTREPNTYEFFLSNKWTGTFDVGAIVLLGEQFNGTIVATTATISVVQKGKKFRVGEVYELDGSGSGSFMIVLAVDKDGGIKSAKLYGFGLGYTSDFIFSLLPVTSKIPSQNYFTMIGSSAEITDTLSEYSDYGAANYYDYTTPGYVDATYVGTIKRSFTNTSSNITATAEDYAIISVKLGPVAKYPGYYANDDGFLDSTRYIQDSKFFQTYSYVIQIDEVFEGYKSIVKNLIHPAGTEIFGENTLTKSFGLEITTSISVS